ncbi:MAG: hypothetical protein IJU40_07135, partial [Desulfovibrionaceae bacterium]|nr:hypothetical protein [Desulfovibrionaceae bacterium]
MKQLLLLSLILLSACAVKETPTVTPKIRSDCQEAWIYAPESLIIELNAGKQVLANPSVHEFPLFCSQTEAQKALQAEISQK